MNIAIIGGGPSALFCALNADTKYNVTIYCKEEKLGKKILVTGNGRCNLSNTKISQDSYNINLQSYWDRFNQHQTLDYFNSLGLEVYADEEGRVYPISNTATSVVDVLAREIEKRKNIKINLSTSVENIKIADSKFIVNNEYAYDKTVVCTGSSTEILNCLNIEYKQFVPSLMALKTKQNTKRLSGLKLSNVNVTLKTDLFTKTEFGEVLFKDNGLSGICIFNLSAYLSRINNFNAKIYIDLLPNKSVKELQEMLEKRLNLNINNIFEFMQGLFHKEINKYILNTLKIDEQLNVKSIDKNLIKNIINLIKNMEFDVISYYENNQVKSGGVELNNLDKNLQSKEYKGLYFAGEVCDVDGLCGGYNLQWAWTSGKIVGDSL